MPMVFTVFTDCCQQTVDNFTDYFEGCQESARVVHIVLCSMFTLNGTIKQRNHDSNDVLFTCLLPVAPV
jgi:hypothetical protein